MTLHSGCTSGEDSADSARLLVDSLASKKFTRMTCYYLNLGLGGIILRAAALNADSGSDSDLEQLSTSSNSIAKLPSQCKGNRKTHQSSHHPREESVIRGQPGMDNSSHGDGADWSRRGSALPLSIRSTVQVPSNQVSSGGQGTRPFPLKSLL